VTRENGKTQIRDTQSGTEAYNRVVMAAHGGQIPALLKDASAAAIAAQPRVAAPQGNRGT
jgi:broad specificity phosphatase PhoE